MIEFDRLGKNGRFGNQMFQYAALKGIAKNNNYDFCIPSGPKTEEDFYDESLFIIGCIPDPTPVQCKFGCRECDSKFWKDTPKMRKHIKEVKEYWEQQEQQQQ